METKNQAPIDNGSELETLEDTATEVEDASGGLPVAAPTGPGLSGPPPEKPPHEPFAARFKRFTNSMNVYALMFGLVMLAILAVTIGAYISSKSSNTTTPISAQTLDQKTLEQLASTSTTVGNANQVLNVQSNAIFGSKVLVRDSLEVAGGLQIGGNLSLAGVTVAGSSTFGQVQVTKNLAVLGDSALQGQVTIQKGLSVSGSGSFGGNISANQVTASTLQLNGDLNLTHHITAGGPTPSRSNGPALGSGGTATVSGSDTSGSVSINTGSGPGAGCFITVNFAAKFNTTPHVLLTPVGSGGAGIAYYVNRSTTNFSVCSANTPPANTSFGFDYLVLD